MVKIHDINRTYRFSICKEVDAMLTRFKDKINKEDQEVWVCFQGDTGCGKSVKAMHWAYVIDPSLDIKRVCFTKEEFIDAILEAKKGQAIIADEAISIFFSRASMTKEGRLIGELINQVRQKNLAIFICLPDLLNLDYIVQKKLNAVINVWESRELKEGKFITYKGNAGVYLNIGKKPLTALFVSYLRRKKANPYAKGRKPSPVFREKGNAVTQGVWYPVGEAAYKKKKEDVLEKYKMRNEDPKPNDLQNKQMLQRDKGIYYARKKLNLPFSEIAEAFGVSKTRGVEVFQKMEKLNSVAGTNTTISGSL